MLQHHLSNGVLTLIFDRPDKFNSFNRELALTVQDRLSEAASNPEVRCVVLTGNGKAFCAGQDLGEAVDPNGPELRAIVRDHYNPIIQAIRDLPKDQLVVEG